LYFALANNFEKKSDFNAAFSAYSKANQIKSFEYPYNANSTNQHALQLLEFFNQQFIASKNFNHLNEAAPIFIVGLPRAGSTLIESILAASDEIDAGGEVTYVPEIIAKLSSMTPKPSNYPFVLSHFSEKDYENIASEYLDRFDINPGLRTTDKLPGNFWHIGLIKLLFPNAKIIHCKKNPLDACLSLFKQNFQQGHPYSYNLEDCADYYLTYRKIMDHWENIFPDQIFNLNYEDLVLNPNAECQKLFDYCEIQWQNSYLNQHKSRAMVRTGSALQIRVNINKNSLNRWEKYSQHLPMLENKLKNFL